MSGSLRVLRSLPFQGVDEPAGVTGFNPNPIPQMRLDNAINTSSQ